MVKLTGANLDAFFRGVQQKSSILKLTTLKYAHVCICTEQIIEMVNSSTIQRNIS